MPEPAATRRARPGGPPGTGREWEIRRFASIDSTNRYLLDEARAGAPDGVVAVADHQTAGRGRLGRTWEAAPGSALLASVLLRPGVGPAHLGLVTMATGLALGDAVREVAGVTAGLKWPNDLVVDDRKLAGLLAEADLGHGVVRAVVVGVGCNLAPAAIPPDLADVATACEIEAGRPVDRDALLDAFLDALAARLDDRAAVPAAYRERSATLGRRVRVDLGGGRVVEGVAVAVGDTGTLVVRDDDGEELAVSVGDVVHLRRASG
ncbi:MAG: biotin--[acetyl-CoA-carboxylase] ligase [Acidimicrobiia bacterium]|jgi:BirA family biotin operon repressor/biotin-[acetyl-CoA-carboxylase] ligase